jgi:hypothetical protein
MELVLGLERAVRAASAMLARLLSSLRSHAALPAGAVPLVAS